MISVIFFVSNNNKSSVNENEEEGLTRKTFIDVFFFLCRKIFSNNYE